MKIASHLLIYHGSEGLHFSSKWQVYTHENIIPFVKLLREWGFLNFLSFPSFPDWYEQSKFCIVKELRNNNLSHSKCVSLAYLNINFIGNKFSSIPHLIDNNLDIFAIDETELDSSFPESQFLLPGMRKPFLLDVTSRKGGLLVFVNNNIPSKYLRNPHLLEIYGLFLSR